MNFMRQGFESYRLTDRQTDTTEIIKAYHAAPRVVNNLEKNSPADAREWLFIAACEVPMSEIQSAISYILPQYSFSGEITLLSTTKNSHHKISMTVQIGTNNAKFIRNKNPLTHQETTDYYAQSTQSFIERRSKRQMLFI